MFFRRRGEKKVSFTEYLECVRTAGFAAQDRTAGRVLFSRGGIATVITDGGECPKVTERAGLLVGDEIATLVDGGFQKFFQTPTGVRKPALAENLQAVHEFEEDLREALGLTSLYNESLGSVSNVYLYDRVKDRDTDHAKRPWEIKL